MKSTWNTASKVSVLGVRLQHLPSTRIRGGAASLLGSNTAGGRSCSVRSRRAPNPSRGPRPPRSLRFGDFNVTCREIRGKGEIRKTRIHVELAWANMSDLVPGPPLFP